MKRFRFPLFFTPTVEAIGNCAEEIYFALLRGRQEGRRVILLFPREFGNIYFSKAGLGINHALTELFYPCRINLPPFLRSFGEFFLTFCFFAFISANAVQSRLVPSSRSLFPAMPSLGRKRLWSECYQSSGRTSVGYVDWGSEFDNRIPLIHDQPTFRHMENRLIQVGLPEHTPFVCLHVREGGYYGWDEGPGKRIRNADIQNYIKAITSLTARGYWVVRLGDETMKPLPELPKVIDYALSEFKNSETDIFLIASSDFYIGHNSGPWDVANLFGKPIMMPNMTDFFLGYPFKSKDLGIFKKIYCERRSRMLTRAEMIQVYLDTRRSPANRSDLRFIENNSLEIMELLDEFLLLHATNKRSTTATQQCTGMVELEAQRQQAAHDIHRMKSLNPVEKDRILSRLRGCNGAIANSFFQRLD